MTNHHSPGNTRGSQLAALTVQNMTARMAMLRIGDPVTARAVANSVMARLDDELTRLVVAAANSDHTAGAMFATLLRQVIHAEAEADASRDMSLAKPQRFIAGVASTGQARDPF